MGELTDFSSELDTILKEHLNNATVFATNTVQNEILNSLLKVCRRGIRDQINKTEFLLIQCDETTDISNQCLMVVTFRYFNNEKNYERFWSFLRIADN